MRPPFPALAYAVWQLEQGECGTPHFQGYASFSAQTRLTAVRKLSARAHWEPRRGSHDQARDYCLKEDGRLDGPWTIGKEPVNQQGKRSDLIALQASIKQGDSDVDLWDAHFGPMLRYHRAVSVYKRVLGKRRTEPPQVHVYWGATGIGKSRTVAELSPNGFYKIKHSSTDWWDGYDGVQDIILEEFYGWLPWMWFLQLLDRYPMVVEVRGGTVNVNSPRIFITSNSHPRAWYRYGGTMVFATLRRRLTTVSTRASMDCEWAVESNDLVANHLDGYARSQVPNLVAGSASTYQRWSRPEMEIPE